MRGGAAGLRQRAGAKCVYCCDRVRNECYAGHDDSILRTVVRLSLSDLRVDECRCLTFEQRDRGCDSCDEYEEVKEESEDRSDSSHRVEYALQCDEQQSRAGCRLKSHSEYCREYSQTCHQGYECIADRYDDRIAYEVLFLGKIRSVSDHYCHTEGQ